MKQKHPTIIAVDFDGTLVHNKYPFCENPNIPLIEWIKAHRRMYVFILHTNREGKQLEYAIKYLKDEFDLTFDLVNENAPWNIKEYGDTRKIFADYYIDSSALTPEMVVEGAIV